MAWQPGPSAQHQPYGYPPPPPPGYYVQGATPVFAHIGATGVAPPPPPGTGTYGNEAGGYYGRDVEAGDGDVVAGKYGPGFGEADVRRGFVRKVFALLSVQLLVTLGAALAVSLAPGATDWVQRNRWLVLVAWGVAFGTLLVLVCSQRLLKRHPWNLAGLSVFTAAFAFLVAITVTYYDTQTVTIAVGITAFLVVGLTAFASQTKVDFTLYGGVLFAGLLALVVFGFLSIFFYSRVVHIVYASLGAFLFSAYLVYDVQLLLGGKAHALGPDDYVIATLMLYIDIINLFLFVLQLVGLARD